MSKFYGTIGFAICQEKRPGVWVDEVVEKQYYGEIHKIIGSNQNSGNVNDNINVSNEISIIADLFANEHYSKIIFVELNGIRWKVSTISIQYPRLVLSVGGVYNG